MKIFLRRSVGIMIIIIMILCISICANASTKSLSLYYTGTNVGSHNTESFNLPAASVYTIKEYSHSGSFPLQTIPVEDEDPYFLRIFLSIFPIS